MTISRMRSMFGVLAVLQLAVIAGAQILASTIPACASSSTSCNLSFAASSSSAILSSTASTPTSASIPSGIVVVDAAGGGHFTAINPAISYAQTFAQPTVIVKSGMYSESVTVLGTAALTIIGESSNQSDYSQNEVTISSSSASLIPMSIGTDSVQGITWKNINFVTSNTGTAVAVSLRGAKNAFYNCQFISAGQTVITATLGTVLIANSYIEGTDKLFYGYLSFYVFESTITATASSATIVYSHGVPTPLQISQIVFDTCSIIQKPGTTNNFVYLAGPNGDGSQAVFKYTSMASMIAPGGTRALSTNCFYGEYATIGPGSYAFDAQPVDTLMTSSMLANCTVDYVFANSFTGYSSPNTSWVDPTVLNSISAANIVTSSSTSAAPSATTSTIISASTSILSISSPSSTSLLSSSTASSVSSTSSTLPTSTCALPTSIPSTAFIVGPSGSCATYLNITSAIAALPVDSTTQYVYILAGTYTEQISSFSRVGPTIFRGESTNPSSQASNLVTIQHSGSVVSSAGGSEDLAVFRSTQYNAKKYAFYNLNFENIAPITPNMIAIAMDIKAQQVGFYSCGFTSGQGTLLANDGTFFLSGCRIEGSSDFIWGYGVAYISNSVILSNNPGYSIAAQSYTTNFPSQMVFDQCAFVPKTTTSMSQSTYLGRDYSASARVAITNSFLDGHINPAGWLIKTTPTNVTFVEANNTGPGYDAASRISQAQIITDDSVYSLASMFGDVSWIDTSAMVPFSGFPLSVFSSVSSSASSTAAASTTSATPSSVASSLPASSTYVVSLTPNATEYGSVESAISALPEDGAEKLILIMPGTYAEQININRTGKVTLRGVTNFTNDYSQNQVTIQFDDGVSTSVGQDESTPVINSKKTDGSGIAVYNINFVNTFVQTNNFAALAADFYGTNMASYGCAFVGFQDTLLANQGTQLFSNCYIEGSADFIWGFSQAYFHQCYIATNTPGASISAQSRASATVLGGFIFDSCVITYTSSYGLSFGLSYLARPWSNYSVAVYKNSYLDKNINSAGWSVWEPSNPQTSHVSFGEYNNVGPSGWTTSTTRASFATNLTDSQVAAYDLITFLGSTSWIDMIAYNYVPSFSFSMSGINGTGATTIPTSPSATANATTSHPNSGTVPPVGAIIVSVGASIAGSFANLTTALASIPSDTTSQIIFMHSGSYTEQVLVSRAGPVTIIGFQSGNVGQTHSANQVTVTFSRGLSVIAPIPVGHTDAETAVISTATNKISFYNVNFINNDNMNGAIASFVTLAASVYGDQIGYYGCSFTGWQDTILTGNPTGYAYYESCYIEGAIDFIWGYSMSYFKGCTIAAKNPKSCVTAQNRASPSATGGYVFDQCLFAAAADAPVDLTQAVFLGRPYSQFAKVVIKFSYLDSIIEPQGWKEWSATDPRLDGVTFAEFENSGPGNWENNTVARLAFGNATLLTSDTYTLSEVMASTSWIDLTYWNSIVTPKPTAVIAPSAGNSTSPPEGACLVSKIAIAGKTTFSTVAGCISNLSSSSTLATIFIFPGIYDEQLTFNRSGATVFQGYTETPGNFSSNQVIITNSHGVNTQSDESNSDSATLYSRGKNLKLYNVNLINSFGQTNDFASLGFAIGNNGVASFYGCQIIGNQDTFDVNVGSSVFAYNTYLEGSVDLIWGEGSFYFLASTISPNTPDISITADKRVTNTSIGGIVFDQCTITPSTAGALIAGMTGSISLGRPWNNNARVAYIKSYLDSCVSAAGWDDWSTSTPNTVGVFFGEYQNAGPGSISTSRATFSHQMTDLEATTFQIANFFLTTSWIDLTALSISPFSVSSTPTTISITSTITPTGSAPVVTQTSTLLSLSTSSIPLSIITKNVTEKISTTIFTTASEAFGTSTILATSTSFSTITPAPKVTTVTLNEIVSTTLTLGGPSSTTTKLITSKTTGFTTVTAPPTTKINTIVVFDIEIVTVTPKTVSQVIISLSTETSLLTSTPEGKTTTLSSISTFLLGFTAAAPQAVLTQTVSSLATSIKTVTPKAVTQTTTFQTTISAGPTVTVKAKSAVTSFVSVTSTIFKTSKTRTTLTCTPATAKVKRGIELSEEWIARRDTTSSSSSSISTVTVFLTLPQSTSTSLVLISTSSITTISASVSTETDTLTSFIIKLSVFPGQTSTSTIHSTKLVSKLTTLPTSTSTVLVDLQGKSVKTTSLTGVTVTELSTIISTVKTSTSTLPAVSVHIETTKTSLETSTTTLPTQTIQSTSTSIKIVKITSVLPTPTVTISKLATVTIKSTFTPERTTKTVQKLVISTEKETTTLPASTVLVTKISTSKIPTPSVTITTTVTKTTSLKTTSVLWTTSTNTPKGLPTCA